MEIEKLLDTLEERKKEWGVMSRGLREDGKETKDSLVWLGMWTGATIVIGEVREALKEE